MRTSHVALVVACAASWASYAGAQTLFTWPDTTVDLAAYTTIEDCRAAVSRSIEYTSAREDLTSGQWRDTLRLDSLERRGPRSLPSSVSETARRCGARFANVDSVPLTLSTGYIALYLQAGWDAKAHALVDRRLTAIGPKNDTERAAVIDTVLDILRSFGKYPIGQRRSAMAQEIVAAHLPKVSDRVKRVRIYASMSSFVSAEGNADSAAARVRKIAEKMAPIIDSLTEREFDALKSEYGALAEGIDDADDFVARYYAMLNMSLGKRAFLDSLGRSTASYVKLKRGNWTRATGMRPETYGLGNPLGERASPIEAEIWLGYDPSKGQRPAPGRVSLIVFLNSHECNGVIVTSSLYGNCARSLAPLSWLEKRFPELEITVVGQSSGYFLYLKEGMTPAKEAALTKQWLEAHGVHAPLAMTTSDSWRLPDPDGRRVSRPTENRTNYSFGKTSGVSNSASYLIDQDGIVVHSRQMNRWSVDEDFAEMIEILLKRQVAAR